MKGSEGEKEGEKEKGDRTNGLSSFVGLIFLVLYTLTLSLGLLPADSGEYQVTGAVLGVAHPPGFALYTMASWLISRVPGIPPATAINFLSALLAAGAVALLCRGMEPTA